MRLLFVYGTLRRGEARHDLVRGCAFAGEARTAARYRLLDLGEYPALAAGGATSVVGELYEVNEVTLRSLDAYEDAPRLYQRALVELLAGGPAEAYVLNRVPPGAPAIPSGDWKRR